MRKAVGTVCWTKRWRAFHSQSVRSEQSPLTNRKLRWHVGRSNWVKSLELVIVQQGRLWHLGQTTHCRELQSGRPQHISRELPQSVREFSPDTPLALDRDAFLKSLKTAPKGSSPGPGGCTYEHMQSPDGRRGYDGSPVRNGNRVWPRQEPSFISVGQLSPQPD